MDGFYLQAAQNPNGGVFILSANSPCSRIPLSTIYRHMFIVPWVLGVGFAALLKTVAFPMDHCPMPHVKIHLHLREQGHTKSDRSEKKGRNIKNPTAEARNTGSSPDVRNFSVSETSSLAALIQN